jgi:hypothetical protein
MTGAVQCRGLKSSDTEEYLRFARQAWGSNSRQAQRSHLQWLYDENPNSRGMEKDLIVLTAEGQIVGAHHRLRLRWNLTGESIVVPSLHDLFVLESHRTGGGLQLVLAALAGESNVALFGLAPSSDQIYERMRIPAIQVYSLRKTLNRSLAGAQIVTSRLHLRRRSEVFVPDAEVCQDGYTVQRTAEPNADLLRGVLAVRPPADAYVDWDALTYRWRFFHKAGPQNVLLAAMVNGIAIGRAVVSIGIGSRRGIAIARIVDFAHTEPRAVPVILGCIDQTLKSIGVPVCYAVTNSTEIKDQMLGNGWSKLETGSARWLTRGRRGQPQRFWVSGGESDFGWDQRAGRS